MSRKNPKSKRVKLAPRKKLAKSAKAKKTAREKTRANRREFRRYATRDLWVTERSGDYQFTLLVENISEGGIFLKGRLKTSSAPSELLLNLGKHGSVTVTAEPIHDCLSEKKIYGTGYRFTALAKTEAKTLRNFFRQLN